MKNQIVFSLAIVFVALSFANCKVDEHNTGQLSITTLHHNKPVGKLPLYIKKRKAGESDELFYRTDFSKFEIITQSDENAHALVTNLISGEYLIHALGFDPLVMDSVKGTQSVLIPNPAESKSLSIPVSEF